MTEVKYYLVPRGIQIPSQFRRCCHIGLALSNIEYYEAAVASFHLNANNARAIFGEPILIFDGHGLDVFKIKRNQLRVVTTVAPIVPLAVTRLAVHV